ncbi:MAG: hypothetical protein QOI05_4282 [Bradyrhizobium sp.]|jgi:hypothetical protein|nr:hypothetical protein [Bradyrhizobium sp.]
MQLETIRGEIERMRAQVLRQRKEILQLQRAGISTASADALLQRMLDRIDTLCAERDRLKKETAKDSIPGGQPRRVGKGALAPCPPPQKHRHLR